MNGDKKFWCIDQLFGKKFGAIVSNVRLNTHYKTPWRFQAQGENILLGILTQDSLNLRRHTQKLFFSTKLFQFSHPNVNDFQ